MMLHHDRMASLFATALGAGAERTSLCSFRWDVSGRCQAPVTVSLTGRPQAEHGRRYVEIAPGRPHTYFGDIIVPCRRCEACLRHRRRLWTARALMETRRAERTWFGTLTLSPDSHMLMKARAITRLSRAGVDWRELDEEQRFAEIHATIGEELTKFFKRVRKQSAARFRYLAIVEAHKSGLPHYHLLIHEQDISMPVRHAVLNGQWKWGFSKFKLLKDDEQAVYVCKYLSKQARARVRASCLYGKEPSLDIVSEGNVSKETPQNSKVCEGNLGDEDNGISSGISSGSGREPQSAARLSTAATGSPPQSIPSRRPPPAGQRQWAGSESGDPFCGLWRSLLAAGRTAPPVPPTRAELLASEGRHTRSTKRLAQSECANRGGAPWVDPRLWTCAGCRWLHPGGDRAEREFVSELVRVDRAGGAEAPWLGPEPAVPHSLDQRPGVSIPLVRDVLPTDRGLE